VPRHVQTHAPSTRRAARKRALTLAQLAGERIIYAYAGLQPPDSLLSLIHAGEAAGVILFSNNIASAPQISAVIHELQAASAQSPLHAPLLILTDQEGGEVRRLPGAPVLSERQIGMSRNRLSLARSAGVGAAVNLSVAGINVSLAPVPTCSASPATSATSSSAPTAAIPKRSPNSAGRYIGTAASGRRRHRQTLPRARRSRAG